MSRTCTPDLNMTTTANPSGHLQFGVPTAEDPMELVSDMDRRPTIDEDNDVDLDLTGDQSEDDVDDYMIDDAISDTDQQLYGESLLQAGNDDEMLDDDDTPQEDEDTMPINDGDLGDATLVVQEYNANMVEDSYYTETLQQDPSPFGQDAATGEPAQATLTNDKDIASMQEGPPVQNIPRTEALTQTNTPELESAPNAVVQSETGTMDEGKDTAGKIPMGCNAHDSSDGMNFPGVTEPHAEDSLSEENLGIRASMDSVGVPQNDGSPRLDVSLPATLRVHPVVVVYQNNEISLFPPIEQNQESSQTFFVHDEKLAGQSISTLLEACRVVLDESIAEEEELEIRIEELGLYINEGAIEAHTTTLTQILDTYLQLQRQDGYENPDPLYLTLCTRIKFSHRLASLVTAAAEGKGLSQLRFWMSPRDSDELSDVQQGENLAGTREVFGEDFTSTEIGAGSPAEQNRKNYNESRPGTPLEDGVSSPARHGIVAKSELVSASEAVESSRNQVATALDATTSEPEVHIGSTIDSPDQEQQQAFQEPIPNKDAQNLQEPGSLSLAAEPSKDNGDTIDYEEEDNVDQEASVGSSTLQGDVSEPAAEDGQLDHSRSIYTADSIHESAAEEILKEKSEVPYSVDKHLSIVGDVNERDHSIAYAKEEHVDDDGHLDAQDEASVELTESGKDQNAHRQEFQDAEEDEEQLEYNQSLQYANHDLLHTTNEDELTDHQQPTPSIPNVDQAFDLANTDQFATADGDEIASQESLYHQQHFHEEASDAFAAEQVVEEDASEDETVDTHADSVINPDLPTARSDNGSHNLPEPATDVDEITYEEDEIEEATDKEATRTDAKASPKVSSATLKRLRSPLEEDNAFETDLLVDSKRVRSG